MRMDNGYMESIKYWSQGQWFFSDNICNNMGVGRYEKRSSRVLSGSGWLGGIGGGGATAPRLAHDIWPTFAPGRHSTHSPLPSLKSPLRLIKLDQDDTNNWLKLEPVCRPNDPYLTPFVAMVSLFPRRAPFGTVYLGSVTSVLARSPAEHNSPLTSWEWQKGYIFRRCLGNYQRAGF